MNRYRISDDGHYVLNSLGVACMKRRGMPDRIANMEFGSELSDADAELVERTIRENESAARDRFKKTNCNE